MRFFPQKRSREDVRMGAWRDEGASVMNSELTDIVWVPGSMEAPLALERLPHP